MLALPLISRTLLSGPEKVCLYRAKLETRFGGGGQSGNAGGQAIWGVHSSGDVQEAAGVSSRLRRMREMEETEGREEASQTPSESRRSL